MPEEAEPPVYRYRLCGWHVESEIPLPELREWNEPGMNVDISIRIGETPAFPGMENAPKRFTIQNAGHCRIAIPGVATLGVREGRDVLIDPILPADSVELRNYLYGTGLGLLCHQRGVFPFHGSCLQMGDKAVIFSGKSGAGKSTLAAALTHRGYRLIADDVCVLTRKDGAWVVWPAFPRVKLKSSAFRAIFGNEPSQELIGHLGKHHFRFDTVKSFAHDPVPLGAIYFLEEANGEEPDHIIEVGGLGRIPLLQSQIFRRAMAMRLGLRQSLFQSAAQIAASTPVRRLCRSFDLDRMNAVIEILERTQGLSAPCGD